VRCVSSPRERSRPPRGHIINPSFLEGYISSSVRNTCMTYDSTPREQPDLRARTQGLCRSPSQSPPQSSLQGTPQSSCPRASLWAPVYFNTHQFQHPPISPFHAGCIRRKKCLPWQACRSLQVYLTRQTEGSTGTNLCDGDSLHLACRLIDIGLPAFNLLRLVSSKPILEGLEGKVRRLHFGLPKSVCHDKAHLHA
jgi:hypothetical protein